MVKTVVDFGHCFWTLYLFYLAGYYNRSIAQWVTDRNGRVVQVLEGTGDMAALDVSGSGMAATADEQEELG